MDATAALSSAPLEQLQRRLQAALGPMVCVVCTDTNGDPASLWPQERAAMVNAVEGRLREFAAGRAAARTVMGRLGWPASAIPVRQDRSPVWPPGLVGSISHNRTTCVAVLARGEDVASLGIDIETDEGIDAALWPIICTPGELDHLARCAVSSRECVVTRVFTAKEAFYKWQFAISGTMLDFQDVQVTLDDANRFRIEPMSSAVPMRAQDIPEGRWMYETGLTIAWIGQTSATTRLASDLNTKPRSAHMTCHD